MQIWIWILYFQSPARKSTRKDKKREKKLAKRKQIKKAQPKSYPSTAADGEEDDDLDLDSSNVQDEDAVGTEAATERSSMEKEQQRQSEKPEEFNFSKIAAAKSPGKSEYDFTNMADPDVHDAGVDHQSNSAQQSVPEPAMQNSSESHAAVGPSSGDAAASLPGVVGVGTVPAVSGAPEEMDASEFMPQVSQIISLTHWPLGDLMTS